MYKALSFWICSSSSNDFSSFTNDDDDDDDDDDYGKNDNLEKEW